MISREQALKLVARNNSIRALQRLQQQLNIAKQQEIQDKLRRQIDAAFMEELQSNPELRAVYFEATENVFKRHRKLITNKREYRLKQEGRRQAVQYYEDLLAVNPGNKEIERQLAIAKQKLRRQ